MPQVVTALLVQLGVSTLLATVISTAVFYVATKLILGGGGQKSQATERTIREPKPPRQFTLGGARRVYGSQMLFTNGPDGSTVDVWAYVEGPVNAVVAVYLNDDAVTISGGFVQPTDDGSYKDNKVLAGYNLGALTNTAHAPVTALVPAWDEDHRGDGIVSGYLIKQPAGSKSFLDIYPQGDNVAMSLAIEGVFAHDPRDPASDPEDSSTWNHTENGALLHLWFYMVYRGVDYATVIAPVEQMWIDAADDCDEAMALAAGGTEPRYRGCVVFDATMEPKDIEAEIRATYDGWTARDDRGCIRIFSGRLYEPTVDIGPSQIIDYRLSEFVEDEESVNEIIVRHVSADHDYNTVECEPWRDEADLIERGRLVSTGVDFQVPSHTQARRLAKRLMARKNAPQRGQVRVRFGARAALTERYVNLRIEDAGTVFFDGVIEIVGGERDYDTGGATLEWVAVDPNVDAWNPATEDGEPAPTAPKFYAEPLDAPVITSAEYDSGQIELDVTGPDRTDLTWFTRWRIDGSSAWSEQATEDADPGSPVLLLIGLVPADMDIEVEAAYSVGDGRVSPWSAPEIVDTTTP